MKVFKKILINAASIIMANVITTGIAAGVTLLICKKNHLYGF